MSEREKAEIEIAEFLIRNGNVFNAPYGVIRGLENFGKGKARGITFGVSRWLDAHILIISPNNIVVTCQGSRTYRDLAGKYSSAKEFINAWSRFVA